MPSRVSYILTTNNKVVVFVNKTKQKQGDEEQINPPEDFLQ